MKEINRLLNTAAVFFIVGMIVGAGFTVFIVTKYTSAYERDNHIPADTILNWKTK